MIHIIDYGMGNLRSVQKAFEKLGVEATVCTKSSELVDAQKLVLPGVGAFRDAISHLKDQDMVGPIQDHIAADRPFLGICLGQQLLFDVSYEDGAFCEVELSILKRMGHTLKESPRPYGNMNVVTWDYADNTDLYRRPQVAMDTIEQVITARL